MSDWKETLFAIAVCALIGETFCAAVLNAIAREPLWWLP